MDPWRDSDFVRGQYDSARSKQIRAGSIVAAGLGAKLAEGPWGDPPPSRKLWPERAALRRHAIKRMSERFKMVPQYELFELGYRYIGHKAVLVTSGMSAQY